VIPVHILWVGKKEELVGEIRVVGKGGGGRGKLQGSWVCEKRSGEEGQLDCGEGGGGFCKSVWREIEKIEQKML